MTIVGYLFGRRSAIETITRTPHALWLGLALVFAAGLARFYDQVDLLHRPLWLLRPVAISVAISLWLFFVFWIVDFGWHWEQRGAYFKRFLPLFWMTAPLAWLYGIPFERFTDPAPALAMNFVLLGIVSFWRVAVLSRALAVAFRASAWRTTSAVLLAADSLFVLASFVLALESIPRAMSSSPPTPTEAVTDAAVAIMTSVSFVGWPICLITCIIAAAARPRRGPAPSLEAISPGRLPRATWVFAALAAGFWLIPLPWTQAEQLRRYHAERLLENGAYSKAVRYLSRYQREDFPPHWKPFAEEVRWRPRAVIESTRAALVQNAPEWIQNVFLQTLSQLVARPRDWWRANVRNQRQVDAFLDVLESLPRDSALVRRNVDALKELLSSQQTREDFQADLSPEQRSRIERLIRGVTGRPFDTTSRGSDDESVQRRRITQQRARPGLTRGDGWNERLVCGTFGLPMRL